jgi:hypothetical protein
MTENLSLAFVTGKARFFFFFFFFFFEMRKARLGRSELVPKLGA